MKTLVTADEIQRSIGELAAEIRRREAGRPLTVIAVMTGSIMFLADLVRKLDMPLRVGVIQARSYQGTKRGSLARARATPSLRSSTVWAHGRSARPCWS